MTNRGKCPTCHSADYQRFEIEDMIDDTVYIRCECDQCNVEFVDVFDLVRSEVRV